MDLLSKGEKAMDQKLYREKSLDRISSPEQLNDYLHVTSPSVWMILTAVIVLLAGLLIWSSVAQIESYAEGSAEVKNGVMSIRFTNQETARKVEAGMTVKTGDTESTVVNVGRDANGLIFATANTALSDGFYNVRVSYKYTQVLSLLFDR